MPYNTKEKRAAATRLSDGRRRATWLAAHPCACGKPSVTAVRRNTSMTPKVVFTLPEDRVAVEVITLCVECRAENPTGKKPVAVTRERKPRTKKVTPIRSSRSSPSFLDYGRSNRIAWREERRARLGYGSGWSA